MASLSTNLALSTIGSCTSGCRCFPSHLIFPPSRAYLSLCWSTSPWDASKQALRCRARHGSFFSFAAKFKACALPQSGSSLDAEKQKNVNDEDSFRVLSAVKSIYNDIVIVDTPKSRMLILDSTHNVHSIVNKEEKWTGSYWDEFASLPAIIPEGPIAIFGLGGGTAARLILDSWPSLQLEGWEIDEILVEKARAYLGLHDLEKRTQAGGMLNVHVGDALSASVDTFGQYAGIVIDLFADGEVLPQLQEVTTWLELKNRLMPNGRLMVNCGGIDEASGLTDELSSRGPSVNSNTAWMQNSTIRALSIAFPGQLSWKRMPESGGQNFLALTGPLPDLASWAASVPGPLKETVKRWRTCVRFP